MKLPLYARYGLPEVWLLDVEGRRLSVHGELGPDGYVRVEDMTSPRARAPALLPDTPVNLAGLFD